jgi:hypothetical protein
VVPVPKASSCLRELRHRRSAAADDAETPDALRRQQSHLEGDLTTQGVPDDDQVANPRDAVGKNSGCKLTL